MRTLLLAAACSALLLLPPAATAQGEGFLVTFHFDTLWFKFHPEGLASTQAGGSGIEVFAQNVKVEGEEVVDLRHCIDGWGDDKCSYGSLLSLGYSADRNGQVTAEEVARFTPIAQAFADRIPKVERLSEILQANITVDGVLGTKPRVVDLEFRATEGSVNSTTPAYADVTVEVGFENDKKAKRHEIHIKTLALEPEGFVYREIKWTLEGDAKWDYKPDDTQPDSVKGRVTKDGWASGQADFESATGETLRLVVELPKKKTPGPEIIAVLGALAAALLLVRRR